MANENFDRWLQFNRLPDESLRDAIYRFSNTTKNPRAAKEYLVDEYRDQVNADDYNKKIQELPEIPSVDSRMAEMPDPETGEYDEPSLDDSFRRAGLQLKKTVGGSLSTLGFQDTGIEMSQEAEERLKQIARPATRAEIAEEGGFLGSIYENLPEGFLGPGELVEGSLSSMAPYAFSLPAYMLGGPIAGVGAGYLASNLQVAGETHDRILDDPTVRRELDLPQGVAYSDMTPMQQTKLKDFAREVSRSAGLRRMYTAGLVELPSLFMPAFRVNKLIPEFIKRQALDITFGSASEVLDENLYASNVANAFRDKGMDDATADRLQQEIREMGPSNWEVFWSAFSQELTMGSVGTAAEVGASRIMGKNRDYRVDDTKTDQNELQNELTRQQEELLPQYEKEAQEAQDKQDERDRKDREEQIKLENARLDFAIKMDQLAQNREKADQDRIKAEEEELERLINIESGFQDEAQKNLGPRLAQLKARELYLKQVQRLRDQGYRMDEIFQDPETGEAKLNVTPDLRYSTMPEEKATEAEGLESLEDLDDSDIEIPLSLLRSEEKRLLDKGARRNAYDNVDLKKIQKEIKARDKRFLEEGPAERFDRLRGEDISYSETTPDVLDEIRDAMDIDPDSEIDQVIDAIDAEKPKTLSAPVLQKVMDGIMSNFEKLKIKNIKFTTTDRNNVLARKLRDLREQFPDVDDQALYDRARLDSTGVGAFVQNRADKDGNQFVVLVPENIRGKTNEEVIRKAVQQIWHELFGHKALRDAYDGIDAQAYKDIINEFDKNNGRDVDDWLNTPGETGGAGYANEPRFRQVEEFIARNFAEFGISKQGKFRKLISSMRKKLREAGFSTIREQDLIAIFEQLQDDYIPNNRSIISGEPLTQTRAVQPEQEEAPQAEEGEVSESLSAREKIASGQKISARDAYEYFSMHIMAEDSDYLKDNYDTADERKEYMAEIVNNEAENFANSYDKDIDEVMPMDISDLAQKSPQQILKEWLRIRALRDQAEGISESRTSDFDRFVSFGGKPPLRQFDKKKFDTRRAPKKTAQDAERYVDATLLESMKNKVWPEQLVKDLSDFDKFPKEFQDGFRKSLSSGLRKPEQELANAVLAKGREAYLQKKKGNVTPDTKPTKGFEVDSGAKWKAIVDDIPKWARTTPQIQRALRQQEISESRLNIITDRAREGSTQQISRVERGFVNPKFLEKFQGEMGEVRGEHRFLQGKDWDEYKNKIKKEGKIYEEILVIKDWDKEPVISEGNHRLDAALEVGLDKVKVDIRYFGQADKQGLVLPESEYQDISESKISDDPKARKMMVLPPKALPGGRVFQQWADRKMVDAEDAPEYRAGGRVIDVSDGMPASAKQPDMTGTTVPYAEIDTNFPGNRASFNVSGVDSQKKITKLPPGTRVTGNRISGGAVIEANLIGQGQAKFIDALPGVNTSTKNIATLQAGQIRKYNEEKDVQKSKKGNYSDHLFATKIVYDTDVELSTTGKDKPQPSVRPRTYGDIIVGNQVGTIKMGDRIAPLYDSLYVVAPGDDISFSFVGEKGFAEFNKRYSGSPSAKEFREDLARQKKGQKGGRWFNPGLQDGKWRLEVPNTGTKLKAMPINFSGRDANWNVDFDDSMMQGSREPDAEYMDNKGNTRKGKLNSMRFMYLKDFVDLGVLTDYYPELSTAYVHFTEKITDPQGDFSPVYYGTAMQLPADNTGLSFVLGVEAPDAEVLMFLDESNMGHSTRDWIEDIYMGKMNEPGHDGIPHRLIATLLHEIQHYIQGKEGFISGGSTEAQLQKLTVNRIKDSIRNNTKGVWASISPNSRLRIQKRFAKVMDDRFGRDQAKKIISSFGLKTPYRGTGWAKGNLFLDDDPFDTYKRWGKKTQLGFFDILSDPDGAADTLDNKIANLVSPITSAFAEAIGPLARDKSISSNDVAKTLKTVNEILIPFKHNALSVASGKDMLAQKFVGDRWSQMVAQSDYLRLAGEVEARDVEQRYIDMVRGNGRSGLPRFLNEKQQNILKKRTPPVPFLIGGTERNITKVGVPGFTGSLPMNVPGEKPVGAPWDVNDMISYSMNDPLADYSERFDITTRARIAQINNLEKGTPQRREAIRQLHLDLILHPIPFKDPTKGLPYQEELESSVPYEDLSWSQRLPGHELSGEQLGENYIKDPLKWEFIRTAKGGYGKSSDEEKTGAGGRGKGAVITGLGLKTTASLKKKKGESDPAYKQRMMEQGKKDFKELSKRAAKLLYKGRIWTNWQKIRDMFGLQPGGRGRDAVPYLGHIIQFMKMQREKLMNGQMTPRDIAKSVVMTLASQGADANNPWTVYNFSGGVKKAKTAKDGAKPADLQTFVEYMNAADWTDGEANIGQKELNGELTEDKVAEWYNESPLWVVNVPWNGEGPNGDMQYAQISDGVMYPRTVSWKEASQTPNYSTNGEKKEGFQYTGKSAPQIVKNKKGKWVLKIDGKEYAGMAHYTRSLRSEAYVANVNNVKRPELQKKIDKYKEEIADLEQALTDQFAGKEPQYTSKGELKAEFKPDRVKAKKKKIRETTLPKKKKSLEKAEAEFKGFDAKLEKDRKETEKNARKQFEEFPLWYRNPAGQPAPNEKTGAVWVPQEYATTGGKPRMEDAVAYYFSTDAGQALLDGIEKGEFDLKEWRKLANVRMAFGDDRLNQLLKPAQRMKNGEFEKAGLRDLTEYTEQFNQIVKNHIVDLDPKDLQGNDDMAVKLRLDLAADLGNFAQKLYGIAEAKQAFFKHFLGLGDAPTIDAIELNTHIAGSPATDLVTSPLTGKPVANTWRVDLKWWSLKLQKDRLSSIPELGIEATASGKTFFEHYRDTIKKAFDDIREDVDTRDPNIFKDVPPDYFYHVMHHWLWDVGKALTRADAVMGESTERFRPAAYEAMWRDANQQVLAYFRNDPIEATMVDWDVSDSRIEHGTPVAQGKFTQADVDYFSSELSESVNLQVIKDKEFFASVSDRFATGFYEAEDQSSNIWPDVHPTTGKKGYWMRGGMGYTTMMNNPNQRIVWATEGGSIVSGVLNMVSRGIRHVVVVVGAPDQLLSNKAYFRIWAMETDDGIRNGKFNRKKINDAIDGMMGKKISMVPDPNMYGEAVGEMVVPLGSELVSETRGRGAPSKLFRTDSPEDKLSATEKMYASFQVRMNSQRLKHKGEDNWSLFKRAMMDTPFDERKKLIVQLGGNWFGKVKNPTHVAAAHRPIWEKAAVYKDQEVGTPVGLLELDAKQNRTLTAQQAGVPVHEAYKFLLKGKVLATYDESLDVDSKDRDYRAPAVKAEDMFTDWENRLERPGYFKGEFVDDKGNKKTRANAFRSLSGSLQEFNIPGAQLAKIEAEWSSGHTPVSFSQMVNTLTTDSRLQADFNNAQLRQAERATSQSIFTRPLDQDIELPGGRKISDIVTRIVEPFGKVDRPEVLRDIRRRTRGRVLRVEEAGAKIYKALVKTKSPDLIYKYLTTKGGDASSIPNQTERAAAKEAKAAIKKVGEELVDRGLLPPQALEKYGDGYLPKLYLQYLLDDNDRYAIQRGQSNKVSNMDYLKRRGYVDKSVADFVKGEVKDPAFLASKATIQPGRDIALLDMFTEMVNTSQENNFNWVLPESVVEYDFVKAIARIAGDNPLGMDLIDELARTEATRADLEAYIETLNKDIKDEREVLRAQDKMQSKALTAMVKERQMMRDKLKTLKPRKMSGYGLKAEADRIFKTIYPQVRAESKDDGQIVADLVADMNRVADDAIGRVIIPSDYMEIPNNARYGKLRGMVVQKEIYDDLVGSLKMMKPENAAEAIIGEGGFLGKASRFFKWSKVTANFPAAWVRNFSSNLVFMNIGGMNMAKIPYYLGAATGEMIKTWNGQRSIYDDVKDFGLTSSTFASVELGKIEKEYENFLNRTQRKGSPFRAFFLAKELLTTAQDWTSDKYGMVDSLGKTMMYMNNIDKGMTPQEAADHAEKWLFDYSLVKPSVKTIRNAIVGAPFITYATKVFPLLVETALTRPWRFAPYFALPYAMAAMFKQTHDLDDEEYEGLMMSLQEYMREKRYAGNIMPLPYLDKFGRPQFLDLAYLYPWGMFTEIASEAQDDPTAIIQTLGLLGGPTASIISVLSTGVDPFTRRPVVNKLDSGEQKVEDALKYVYNLMMPPFLHTDYGALNRLSQTMNGELNRYGEPMKTIAQGISQTVGFNVSPVEPGTQRQRNARYMQSEILKTMGYAKRTLRDMKRMGKSNEEILEKNEYFKKLLKERKEKLKEYIKSSKFPKEKLKQAN